MKDRPILFSGAMVRAVLDGTKTQTRRIVKPHPAPNHPHDGGTVWVLQDGLHVPMGSVGHLSVREKQGLRCPYGQPGDRLWVRESWAEVPRHEPQTDEDQPYREDGRIVVYAADPHWEGSRQFLCADGVLRWARPERWRPSIHMPRWASRITLEITGVRVERLQDISDADAVAEGLTERNGLYATPDCVWQIDPRKAYRDLWEQINGPGSWDANPWVWAVDFKRLEAAA